MHSTPTTPGTSWRRGTALAATALLAAATSACGGGDGGGGGGGQRQFDAEFTTDVPAATSAVDSVTWNLTTGEPLTLDPAQSAQESISVVVANMCEGLFRFDEDYGLTPALAESMENPDPLTYVFTLRSGATFWDGQPVTADDVVYSVTRLLDPALASPWAAWAVNFESITATAPDQVTLTLSRPDPLAENFFALPAFTVVQKAFAEQAGPAFGSAGAGVMCTGPYELAEWDQGQSIELTRNPDWWGDTEPLVEAATFTFTTDASAQVASLRSGETDGQWIVPTAGFDQLGEAGNLLFGESLQSFFVSVTDLTGPLGDPAVREALQAAIDYQGISESVYRGTAPLVNALVPPTAYGYAEDVYEAAYDELPAPTQDLDRVAELVADTPRATEELVLAYSVAADEDTRSATAIADAANQAGMNVTLRPLTPPELGALFASPQAREGIDALIGAGYLDYPEPLAYYQFFTTGSFYNFPSWSDPDYDALIGEALGTVDDDERAELVTQAQQILLEQRIVMPIVELPTAVYYGPDLAGLLPSDIYRYTPWLTALGGE